VISPLIFRCQLRLRQQIISWSAARAAPLINSWVPVLIVCRSGPMSVQPRWECG
jgi:hypothetical protein